MGNIVLLEDLLAEQVALMSEVTLGSGITRKPSFGWGNSNALRKFIHAKGNQHNPLIWLVPRQSTPSGEIGQHERVCELNLCCIEEDRELLNGVRLNPGRSFKSILMPLWDQLKRRMCLSSIEMIDDIPSVDLFPDYMINDETEAQYVWDVMKLTFTVRFNNSPTGL